VRGFAIHRGMALVGRFSNSVEEVSEVLDRPWAFTRTLALDRARPAQVARRFHEDRDVDMCARQRMQRVQSLNDHHIGGLDVSFADAPMDIETPLRDVCRAACAKFREIARKPREIGRFGKIAECFRRPVVVGKIVIGRKDEDAALGIAGSDVLLQPSGERRLSRSDGTCKADDRVPTDAFSAGLLRAVGVRPLGDRDDRFVESEHPRIDPLHPTEDTPRSAPLPYLSALEIT
jgi:hypothetical protein